MIELPEYKSPNARTIAIYVWQKIKDYLTKAGTVIFIASVIMWGILNFGPNGDVYKRQFVSCTWYIPVAFMVYTYWLSSVIFSVPLYVAV